MRVLHIVTWIDQPNSFGGPTVVARNLSDGLKSAGHDALLVAAGPKALHAGQADGGEAAFRGFRLTKRGFVWTLSPSLLWWLWRNARRFDMVHVHLGRDLVSLPAAWIAARRGVPFVCQTHGMVAASSKRLAAVLDRLLTRRVLRSSKLVLALTELEKDALASQFGQSLRIAVIPNGVPVVEVLPDEREVPEFLFLARLHERKRPLLLARVAMELLQEGFIGSFVFIGVDEGEATALDQLIEGAPPQYIRRDGPLSHDDAVNRLSRCSVLVLPSVSEPFPMVVLEAMSAGRPVIISRSCGLAASVTEYQAGTVIQDDNHDELRGALIELGASSDLRLTMGRNGARAIEDTLSISRVAEVLVGLYE